MLHFDTLRSPKPEVTDSVAQLKDELTEARVDKQMKHQKIDSTGHTLWTHMFHFHTLTRCAARQLYSAMERKWRKTHQIMPLIKPDHGFDKRFNTHHIGYVQLADVMALLSPTYWESTAFVSPWVHTFGLRGQDECETAGWAQRGLIKQKWQGIALDHWTVEW